jgi:predicted amidophosphoribosyltransferase
MGRSETDAIQSLLEDQDCKASSPDTHVRRLLQDLAKRSPAAINHFARQLSRWRALPNGAVLCVVPPLRPGAVVSGIRQAALRLCELGEWLDGTHCLTRTRAFDERTGEHPEASLMRQLTTLAVRDTELIQDRQVVLLTDISRSGKTLRAGEMLLLRAGAREVAKCCLATELLADAMSSWTRMHAQRVGEGQ